MTPTTPIREDTQTVADLDLDLDLDVLVTAGAVGEAPCIDSVPKWADLAKPGFNNPFNIAGRPAMCVCSGYGEGGLPLAVQIAAKPFQETLLFQVANAFEKAIDLRAPRPLSLSQKS